MAIIGLTLGAERVYYSKLDTSTDLAQKTKFTLGSLDSRILGMLLDKTTTVKVNTAAPEAEVDTHVNQKAFNFEVCQFGIRNWENLKDAEGNDIPCRIIKLNRASKTYNTVDAACLSRLPSAILDELAMEIMKDNTLTEEAGNA